MKRIIASLLAFVFVAPVFAADWTAIATKVRPSTVNIESADGRCTGFIIDDGRDFVLTAAHCDGHELYVDLAPAKVRAKDVKNDLMVLHVEGIDGPDMKLAAADPKIGEQVASYGFGVGWERPMFRTGYVSDNATTIPGIEGGPWIVVDNDFIPGQSGGFIINAKGEVVSIVQRGGSGLGLGVSVEVIKAKIGKYFAGGK
jgi:S1-C subfamily serine protease